MTVREPFDSATRKRRERCRNARGMTLIEILVVMAIIAALVTAVIAGSNRLPSARLKYSATLVSSAVRNAYARATSTSRSVRVVFDLDSNKIWLEEGDLPMLVQTKDRIGTGGADPMTEAERFAAAEGEKIVKGPPVAKPHFKPIEQLGFGNAEGPGGKPLQSGIKFREVQAQHDDSPRTSGRAYLYFWPGGLTERASIQVRIGDSTEDSQTLTLIVSPLTGRVAVKTGPVAMPAPLDDREASEREDTSL